jgi:hypothetical protein
VCPGYYLWSVTVISSANNTHYCRVYVRRRVHVRCPLASAGAANRKISVCMCT